MSSTETKAVPTTETKAAPATETKAASTTTTAEPSFTTFPNWVVQASRKYRPASLCVDYGLLRAVQESQYSSLLPHQIPGVVAALASLGKLSGTIVDATAHIGCDTIFFSRLYPNLPIIAIESDAHTFNALRHNLAVSRSHATAVNADCTQYLADVVVPKPTAFVYFDPPWGGRDYGKAKSLVLELGGRPVSETISHTLENVSPLVVLKAPNNIDIGELGKIVTGELERIIPIVKPTGKSRGAPIYKLLIFRRIRR